MTWTAYAFTNFLWVNWIRHCFKHQIRMKQNLFLKFVFGLHSGYQGIKPWIWHQSSLKWRLFYWGSWPPSILKIYCNDSSRCCICLATRDARMTYHARLWESVFWVFVELRTLTPPKGRGTTPFISFRSALERESHLRCGLNLLTAYKPYQIKGMPPLNPCAGASYQWHSPLTFINIHYLL